MDSVDWLEEAVLAYRDKDYEAATAAALIFMAHNTIQSK